MTKSGALFSFFSRFGLDVYEENTVYSLENPPAMPYLTYEQSTDSFSNDSGVYITVNLFYRSTSWTAINAKTEEISAVIGNGGKIIDFDGGHIWIKRGRPFARNLSDPADDMVRRKLINLQLEFFCEN